MKSQNILSFVLTSVRNMKHSRKLNLSFSFKAVPRGKQDKKMKTFQVPIVRKVDNAIHRINHYPVDSVVCFVNTYPLDSDLSGG